MQPNNPVDFGHTTLTCGPTIALCFHHTRGGNLCRARSMPAGANSARCLHTDIKITCFFERQCNVQCHARGSMCIVGTNLVVLVLYTTVHLGSQCFLGRYWGRRRSPGHCSGYVGAHAPLLDTLTTTYRPSTYPRIGRASGDIGNIYGNACRWARCPTGGMFYGVATADTPYCHQAPLLAHSVVPMYLHSCCSACSMERAQCAQVAK